MSNTSDRLKIGVWGPRASGKTTYLVMVWGACLAPGARWFARPGDVASSDFFSKRLSLLLQQGEFPEPTAPRSEPTIYSYYFAPRPGQTKKDDSGGSFKNPLDSFINWIAANDAVVPASRNGQGLTVSFTDVAGEQYLTDPIDSPLWNDIAGCKGLICLLDPAEADQHFQMTLNLVQSLWLKYQSSPYQMLGENLPHYVALCFSKIDQAGFCEFADKPERLLKHLSDKTHIDLSALLGSYFMADRLRFFCTSSVGVDDQGKSLAQGGRVLASAQVRPINIISPLRWLFETLQG